MLAPVVARATTLLLGIDSPSAYHAMHNDDASNGLVGSLTCE